MSFSPPLPHTMSDGMLLRAIEALQSMGRRIPTSAVRRLELLCTEANWRGMSFVGVYIYER